LYINKIIGAIFCQVSIIRQLFQFNPSITSGNQKWKGAAPIFVNKAELKINNKGLLIKNILKFIDIIMIENKKIVEAMACVIKYFREASEEKRFFVLFIRGMIDNRLISNPIHIPIHE